MAASEPSLWVAIALDSLVHLSALKNLNKRVGLFPFGPVALALRACLNYLKYVLFGVSISSVAIRHRSSDRECSTPRFLLAIATNLRY